MKLFEGSTASWRWRRRVRVLHAAADPVFLLSAEIPFHREKTF